MSDLRTQGWEYLQRLADRPPVVYEPFPEDFEDLLVEPPDPSIWTGLPVTSWLEERA